MQWLAQQVAGEGSEWKELASANARWLSVVHPPPWGLFRDHPLAFLLALSMCISCVDRRDNRYKRHTLARWCGLKLAQQPAKRAQARTRNKAVIIECFGTNEYNNTTCCQLSLPLTGVFGSVCTSSSAPTSPLNVWPTPLVPCASTAATGFFRRRRTSCSRACIDDKSARDSHIMPPQQRRTQQRDNLTCAATKIVSRIQ